MDILTNFRQEDFITQMNLLSEVEKSADPAAIEPLAALVTDPLNDDSVDFMVRQTLKGLLAKNEDVALSMIGSDDPGLSRMGVEVAGENGFSAAAPVLMEKIEKEADPSRLFTLMDALSAFEGDAFLPVFESRVRHPDDTVAALAIETLGKHGDENAVSVLKSIVTEAEEGDNYKVCGFATYKAIEALSAIGSDDALSFLVDRLHHKSPAARREIQRELSLQGEKVVPFIAPVFDTGETDDRIMAANLLGTVGSRKGADIMVAAMDAGKADDPNVRYAILEALGFAPSMKGLICLMDELDTTDEMLLMAVVVSLNRQAGEPVIKKIVEHAQADPEKGRRILHAVAATGSFELFDALWAQAPLQAEIVKCVGKLKDEEALDACCERLEAVGGDRGASFAGKIRKMAVKATGKRILAVDDSRAMTVFYRTALTELGYRVTTAGNGKEGMAAIAAEGPFDLIISDMNMPEMDGIEFTRLVRAESTYAGVPVIMATTETEGSQQEIAKSAGVTGFISKPFTAETLRKTVSATGVAAG